MLAAPHMMAGAAIGKLVRPPWLAVAAALASHFFLDIVPHLDSHTMFGAAGGGTTPAEATAALLDTAAGIALVLLLVRGRPRRALLLWAAFAGVGLDLFDNVPPWGNWFQTWRGTAWLSRFHHSIQHNLTVAQWPLGLIPQVVVLACAFWVLLQKKVEPRFSSALSR